MTVSQFSIRASSGRLTKGELEASSQALKEIDDEVASRKRLASDIPSFLYQASSQSSSNKKYDFRK